MSIDGQTRGHIITMSAIYSDAYCYIFNNKVSREGKTLDAKSIVAEWDSEMKKASDFEQKLFDKAQQLIDLLRSEFTEVKENDC